jgi:CcmD family protein
MVPRCPSSGNYRRRNHRFYGRHLDRYDVGSSDFQLFVNPATFPAGKSTQEGRMNTHYFFAAYLAFWLITGVYLLRLNYKLKKIEQLIDKSNPPSQF